MKYVYQSNTKHKTLSRNLRKNQTETERFLWSKLRGRQIAGYKFYRQFTVLSYILDFYCPAKKLAIELDGSQHVQSRTQDDQRTHDLEKQGINVLRFWDNEVFTNTSSVLEIIYDHLTRNK